MILIGNGPLITWNNECPFYEKGAVLVDGEKVSEIGNYEVMKNKYPEAELIDAKGKIIMPGLIDAHEHIYSAFARGSKLPMTPPNDFLEILDGTWWTLDRSLSLENTYYSAVMTYMECIRNGITFVIDHHAGYGSVKGSLGKISKAADELSMRTCLSYEVSDRDGVEKRNQAIEENMEFIESTMKRPSNMKKGLIGLHASFTLSDETLEICKRENKFDAGYHVHIAEGIYDEEHCMKKYGMSVTERFAKRGILSRDTIAGHCVHISKSDKKLLKLTNTSVIHNPESNMANAVGVANILTLLDEGLLVGLGTDGYTHDMFESLKVANILQKHINKRSDRGFMEACNMLYKNNAKIASRMLGETIGIIRKDALADIIILDYHPATPLNADNIFGHLMFGMSGSMTDTVMINGKICMQGRVMTNINENELLDQCRQSAADLWKNIK